MLPGFLFPRMNLPLIPLPFTLCTLFLRTLLILRFFVSSVRIACLWTSLVLRFFVSSVHQILQLCFAGSAILCQFSTLDPALCFAGSTILCQFSTLDPAFNPASVLRQFFDSASVPLPKLYFVSGLPPILQFFAGFVNPAAGFANSSILC